MLRKTQGEVADPALLLHLFPDLENVWPLIGLQLQVLPNVIQESGPQGDRVEQSQISCQACCDLVIPVEEYHENLWSGIIIISLPILEIPRLLLPHRVIKLTFVKVDHLDKMSEVARISKQLVSHFSQRQ